MYFVQYFVWLHVFKVYSKLIDISYLISVLYVILMVIKWFWLEFEINKHKQIFQNIVPAH